MMNLVKELSNDRLLTPLAAGILVLSSALSLPVHADSVKIITGAPPSASELANMLFPERANSGAAETEVLVPRTRSIVFTDSKPARKAPTQRPEGFGFLINFALNSTQILPDSRPYLDQVGEMLNLAEIIDQQIVIEGHTDASGSASYNRNLSQQRAQAVKQYLVQNFQIQPQRLVTAGKGEHELLDGRSPRDPQNRRVQFHRAYP